MYADTVTDSVDDTPASEDVVVDPGMCGAGVRAWNTLTRNVRDDYKRAFGEEPGAVTAIGVLTDTDNTGGTVESWYGDMRFSGQP